MSNFRPAVVARVFGIVALVALAGTPSPSAAQSALIGGGLTQLPQASRLGASLVLDGGFESPLTTTPWSADAAWAMDLLVYRSGRSSLRLSNAHLVQYHQAAGQTLTLRKGVYRLSGWIRTSSLGANRPGSGVRLALKSADGGAASTRIVSGTTGWTFYELRDIVIASDQTASARLEAYGDPSGTAWFDDVRVEQQLPHPLDVFMLYPNFRGMLFDDQHQELRFEVNVTPPVNNFARYRVVVTLREEGSTVTLAKTTVYAAPQILVELGAVGLRYDAAYLATVTLVDTAYNTTVYTAPPYRVSRVPASARAGMNISFDDQNRILVRGEPRFILGVYDSGIGYGTSDAFWEDTLWSATGLRRLGTVRINAYLNYHLGGMGTIPLTSLMNNLEKRDVLYFQTANCFAGSRGTFPVDQSDSYVLGFAEHMGAAGYYTADECYTSMIPGTFTQYQRLRRLHPDSMTIGAFQASRAAYMWRDSIDVLMTDPYPLYSAEPSGGYRHYIVADWTAGARNALRDARPTMTVLQFFKTTSNSRWPTWAELRSHAYMAIVEGAKGLWWWSVGRAGLAGVCSGWCDEKLRNLGNLRAVVDELASLEAVLVADDRDELLTYNSKPSAIRTLVKAVGGHVYVFAYNYTGASTTVTLSTRGAFGSAVVYRERRALPVTSGSFTDTFGPYRAHVYVIESTAVSTPPAPTVDTAPLTALAPLGTVSTRTPTFRWTPFPSTSERSYELVVTDSSGHVTRTRYAASQLGCAGGTSVCSVALPTALPPGTAQWRVLCWEGELRASETLTFQIPN